MVQLGISCGVNELQTRYSYNRSCDQSMLVCTNAFLDHQDDDIIPKKLRVFVFEKVAIRAHFAISI